MTVRLVRAAAKSVVVLGSIWIEEVGRGHAVILAPECAFHGTAPEAGEVRAEWDWTVPHRWYDESALD
ncbi:hypothetical protein ACFY4C_02170 [Actinomadura viridis]|uniref:hypothetical protein n=1 Tax=Actinomadura viridis TaxID=58110 RepID=UPI00369D8CD3